MRFTCRGVDLHDPRSAFKIGTARNKQSVIGRPTSHEDIGKRREHLSNLTCLHGLNGNDRSWSGNRSRNFPCRQVGQESPVVRPFRRRVHPLELVDRLVVGADASMAGSRIELRYVNVGSAWQKVVRTAPRIAVRPIDEMAPMSDFTRSNDASSAAPPRNEHAPDRPSTPPRSLADEQIARHGRPFEQRYHHSALPPRSPLVRRRRQ